MDRNDAEGIIRQALGKDADQVLRLIKLGLDPVGFIESAIQKAYSELRTAGPTTAVGGSARRPRMPTTSPPPSGQPCFEVRSTATDLLDPVQAALFVMAGEIASPDIQRQFAKADRVARREVAPIRVLIHPNRELRLSDILRGIVRGASETDEEVFAAVKPRSSRNPAVGRVNVFELQVSQCLAILKHQFKRPAISKPACPYLIHKASSSILGRGGIGLVHDADERIKPALQRWNLWSRLRRHAHDCRSSQEAISTILRAFSGRSPKLPR